MNEIKPYLRRRKRVNLSGHESVCFFLVLLESNLEWICVFLPPIRPHFMSAANT